MKRLGEGKGEIGRGRSGVIGIGRWRKREKGRGIEKRKRIKWIGRGKVHRRREGQREIEKKGDRGKGRKRR